MSRRKYGSPVESLSELPSEQDTIPTSESIPSTVEASPSSEQSSESVDSEATTPMDEFEPQCTIIFGKTGIRIVLSDDMPKVGGGQLERAYIALMREAQLQRVRLVHQNRGDVKDAA